MPFYHGTCIEGLKELKPIFKRQNTIKKPVIYFSRNKLIALLYIWKESYRYVTFDINNEGIVEYIEEFPNQLYEFYNGNRGCIYECDEDSNDIYESHIKGVFISSVPIRVSKTININNTYEEILKEEKLGNIIIKRYDTLTVKESEEMRKARIRAIHMQGLLNPREKQEECMAEFMKEKFPIEWQIALQNTKEEIKEMINQWRICVGLQPL
jgi:hypothetical protein